MRRLVVDDYEDLVELWTRASLPFKPKGRDSRREFIRQLGVPQLASFGIFFNDELVGSVLASHDGRKGWINRVAVLPEHQRNDVGTQLVKVAEYWLEDQGIGIVAALVEGENPGSRALLESCDYELAPQISYYSKRRSHDV